MGRIAESEMTFWDHLEELRKVLFRILGFLLVASILVFSYMQEIFDNFILAPTRNDFFFYKWLAVLGTKFPFLPNFCIGTFNVKIININLASQFMIHMSTSLWLGCVISFPLIISQVYVFVKPALYATEQKSTLWAFSFASVLFYLGVALGYAVVFPLTLRFLAGYELSTYIENSVSLDSYIESFIMLCLMMGLVFELPLLSWILSQIGILKRSFFNKYRKHAIVILLFLAAVITPTGDPFTLMVVFLPFYFLWELSYLVVKK
jgi:sec-independent protein translocase protein TatC